MSDKRSVLITGATGQQGGAVAHALMSKGHRVKALTRKPDSDAARRYQPPGSVAVRFAGQRLDAMSPGQKCAGHRASLLAGRARDQNASFGAHVTAPLVFHWSKLEMPY